MAHDARARLLPLLIASLFLGGAFAGCLTGDAEPPEEPIAPVSDEDNRTLSENATLPDGREFKAADEINKTEEGEGGVDHLHDYWEGRETVVAFDDLVQFSATPVYPDGEGTQAKSVAYVKLPCVRAEGASEEDPCAPSLVYEGAERVDVVASAPTLYPQCEVVNCEADGLPADPRSTGIPHPAPPALDLQYRSAADADWREPMPLAYDAPLSIEVAPLETDMPHSVRSLWVFRITTASTDVGTIHLMITVHRGRDVVDWPGHPDFYAESNSRKVMDQHVTTQMSGVKEGYLYDAGGTWATPERLISHGTSKVIVIANVTSVTTATGQTPTGFFLESHDATVIGPEIRFGDRWSDRDATNDLASYDFEIPVALDGMDGPYQPSSRWGFRLMATFADIDVPEDAPGVGGFGLGLCPACFEYTIEYDIVVIAIHEPEGS